MNMPEVTAGLLLLLTLWFLNSQKYVLAGVCTLLGVLTREEVTFVLIILGLYYIYKQSRKESISMFIGGTVAMFIWSAWSYIKTDIWFFWIISRDSGSSWDAMFNDHTGSYFSVFMPFLSLLIAFPFIILLTPQTLRRNYKVESIAFVAYFVIIFTLQFRYFSYPDARYFATILPVCAVLLGFSVDRNRLANKRFQIASSILIIAALVSEFIFFYFKSFTYSKYRETATYIGAQKLTGNLLMDTPMIAHEASMHPSRIYSSDQVLVDKNAADVKIDSLGIRYVVAEDVSYSRVMFTWPQMALERRFEQGGKIFTKIYEFQPVERLSRPFGQLQLSIEKSRGPIAIWEIK